MIGDASTGAWASTQSIKAVGGKRVELSRRGGSAQPKGGSRSAEGGVALSRRGGRAQPTGGRAQLDVQQKVLSLSMVGRHALPV